MSQNPGYPPIPGQMPYQQQPTQGYPQQYQQQPQAQPQQYQQPQPPPQPYQGAQIAGPSQMPAYNMPQDRAAAEKELQGSEGGGKGKTVINGLTVRFADILGPRGEKKWGDGVPQGYSASMQVILLPSWEPKGIEIYRVVRSHFFRSSAHPKGTGLGCPGKAVCRFCQAADVAKNSPNPEMKKRGEDWGKSRSNWAYNCVAVEFPQLHLYEDGQVHPLLLYAGYSVWDGFRQALLNLHRSYYDAVDPRNATVWALRKTKSGGTERDIDYSVTPIAQMPLPQSFWGALSNLWDLSQLDRSSTEQEQIAAAIEIGFLAPQVQAQVPQQYGPPMAMVPPQGYGAPAQQQYQPQQYQQPQSYQQQSVQMQPMAQMQMVPVQPQMPPYNMPVAPQSAPYPWQPELQSATSFAPPDAANAGFVQPPPPYDYQQPPAMMPQPPQMQAPPPLPAQPAQQQYLPTPAAGSPVPPPLQPTPGQYAPPPPPPPPTAAPNLAELQAQLAGTMPGPQR